MSMVQLFACIVCFGRGTKVRIIRKLKSRT